jgi:hypothetical protein
LLGSSIDDVIEMMPIKKARQYGPPRPVRTVRVLSAQSVAVTGSPLWGQWRPQRGQAGGLAMRSKQRSLRVQAFFPGVRLRRTPR